MIVSNRPVHRISQVYDNQSKIKDVRKGKNLALNDEVELSSEGKEINAIMHNVKGAADIRPKADQIKQAVKSGTYQFSSRQTALGILKTLNKG